MLVDPAPSAETILAEREDAIQQTEALYAAVNLLTAQERRVFQLRRLASDPVPLGQLAFELSVSTERVRQIEVQAFAKVRRAARSQLDAAQFGHRPVPELLRQESGVPTGRLLEPSVLGTPS
ncbi:sigma factor-like helix-turn-helix DNA-binding protein [Bradyrhizobium genosp. P]|uniref:sigma factor-like helix-turn-helix DNA-binding protein n=1 Tax=Bradyrhizobium genosp. P TaxID=83641 RepID=UPI003CF980AB